MNDYERWTMGWRKEVRSYMQTLIRMLREWCTFSRNLFIFSFSKILLSSYWCAKQCTVFIITTNIENLSKILVFALLLKKLKSGEYLVFNSEEYWRTWRTFLTSWLLPWILANIIANNCAEEGQTRCHTAFVQI
jgi:hypothetical protein